VTRTNRLHPILYPKHLNLFAQCPERYFHERVERRTTDQQRSLAMVRGIAAHDVMSGVANEYEAFFQAHGVPAVPSNLDLRVQRALPRDANPDADAWARDVNALTKQIKHGVAYLDGDARVLTTEATYHYPHPGDSACPPFILAAKVDLVLLRQSADGATFIDVVDWKSGASSKLDAVQELANRVIVQHNARRRLGVEPAFIQNTTMYFGTGAQRSIVIADEEGRQRWAALKQLAAGILRSVDWPPNPSPLCEWCPFFGNGCSLEERREEPDAVRSWLEPATV
jgi:hypothetical protein